MTKKEKSGNKLIGKFCGELAYYIIDKGGSFISYRGLRRNWEKKAHAESYLKSKGLDKKGYKTFASSDQYDYHSSWNSLMSVIDKIRTIQLPSPSMIPVGVTIDNYGCRITDGCWNASEIVSKTKSENPNVKELTWKAVVEFIKWYNKNKK